MSFPKFSLRKHVQSAACLAGLCVFPFLFAHSARAQMSGGSGLEKLTPGQTRAENPLWHENPLNVQFASSKTGVVAGMNGPGIITMIHFAIPSTLKLNRDVLLRVHWDNESSPSVDVPLVDFLADPDGLQHRVNTALVNKLRGWNAYFPMPFRHSAKIELVYDGPLQPREMLEAIMPCYS